MGNAEVEPILGATLRENSAMRRYSGGNRVWSVASRAINFIKINFNSRNEPDIISLYRKRVAFEEFQVALEYH